MRKVVFALLLQWGIFLQASATHKVDIIEYVAELTPSLATQTLEGKVRIHFRLSEMESSGKQALSVVFAAENMNITAVSGDWLAKHRVEAGKLYIELNKQRAKANTETAIVVEYSAAPQKGVIFAEDYLYTLYHTQQWLVSHEDIGDKAKFDLTLYLPEGTPHVANGKPVNNKVKASRNIKGKGGAKQKLVGYRWRETRPRPIFTFGFAAGKYQQQVIQQGNREFQILYRNFTPQQIATMFADIGKAYRFFEKVSGQALYRKRYTFVVTEENSMQEAAGFSLVGRKYLEAVLDEPRETWLATHELAHEWWGNAISAASWNHFWLNEGLVQFLVAAFKEQAYGRDEYEREIIFFKESLLRKLKKASYLPAVSPRKPISLEEYLQHHRGLSYSKGAFLFHMLRIEVGERDFWRGIKHYSSQAWESTATTQALQQSFEQVSGRSLNAFFDTWVYGEQRLGVSLALNIDNNNLLQAKLSQTPQDLPAQAPEILPQQLYTFPLKLEAAQGKKTTQLSWQVHQTEQNFSHQLAWQPSRLRIDPQQFLPLEITSESMYPYLLGNVQQGETVFDKYWGMKALVNSRFCQESPALIQAALQVFSQPQQPRILQEAADWWGDSCTPIPSSTPATTPVP